MDFLTKKISSGVPENAAAAIFSALAAGDVTAAWLISEDYASEKNCVATLFNRAVCRFRFGEWEKAAGELRDAESLLPNTPAPEKHDRKALWKAVSLADEEAYASLPMHPAAVTSSAQYARMRVRWLMALCQVRSGKKAEAETTARWLKEQFGIVSVLNYITGGK